jgi:hypothetical protein
MKLGRLENEVFLGVSFEHSRGIVDTRFEGL